MNTGLRRERPTILRLKHGRYPLLKIAGIFVLCVVLQAVGLENAEQLTL
jgi:hypothetical protein